MDLDLHYGTKYLSISLQKVISWSTVALHDMHLVSCPDLKQTYSSTVCNSFQAFFRKKNPLNITRSLPLLFLIYRSSSVADPWPSPNCPEYLLFHFTHFVYLLLHVSWTAYMTNIALIMHSMAYILKLISPTASWYADFITSNR